MDVLEIKIEILRKFEAEEMEAYQNKISFTADCPEREKFKAIEQTWISAKWIVHDTFKRRQSRETIWTMGRK